MCPVVGFGPWLGLGKPLVEILPPGQLRGFCPLLAWLGSAVLGYGPVLSFGLVGGGGAAGGGGVGGGGTHTWGLGGGGYKYNLNNHK